VPAPKARREGDVVAALDDEVLYDTLLDSLQNEGMAVYMAYRAQSFFPAKDERDNRLLEDAAEVRKRIEGINRLFDSAERKILSEEALRRAWNDAAITFDQIRVPPLPNSSTPISGSSGTRRRTAKSLITLNTNKRPWKSPWKRWPGCPAERRTCSI
jgi:hypothetical protein